MYIDITEKAQEALNKKLQNKENIYIRIFIQGFGWAGPRFGIALEEAKDEVKDHIEKVNDFNIVVEKELLEQFKKFIIDYSNSWFSRGFTVFTGNGMSSC